MPAPFTLSASLALQSQIEGLAEAKAKIAKELEGISTTINIVGVGDASSQANGYAKNVKAALATTEALSKATATFAQSALSFWQGLTVAVEKYALAASAASQIAMPKGMPLISPTINVGGGVGGKGKSAVVIDTANLGQQISEAMKTAVAQELVYYKQEMERLGGALRIANTPGQQTAIASPYAKTSTKFYGEGTLTGGGTGQKPAAMQSKPYESAYPFMPAQFASPSPAYQQSLPVMQRAELAAYQKSITEANISQRAEYRGPDHPAALGPASSATAASADTLVRSLTNLNAQMNALNAASAEAADRLGKHTLAEMEAAKAQQAGYFGAGGPTMNPRDPVALAMQPQALDREQIQRELDLMMKDRLPPEIQKLVPEHTGVSAETGQFHAGQITGKPSKDTFFSETGPVLSPRDAVAIAGQKQAIDPAHYFDPQRVAAEEQAMLMQVKNFKHAIQETMFEGVGGMNKHGQYVQSTPATTQTIQPFFGEGGPSAATPGAAKALASAKNELEKMASGGAGAKIAKDMASATRGVDDYAHSIFLATKRYTAFIVGTSALFAGIGIFSAGVKSVIDLDKAMVKLDQTINPTKADLAGIKSTILDLSVSTGTSADELAKAAVSLAQAGYEGKALKDTLSELANVPLLPSFDGIEKTTTGLIAIFGAFQDSAGSTRDVMDKLDVVAKKYAVTSADLIEAVERGGGTFKQLGGSFEQYIALVTQAKQKTQESMESIGTGFRSISSRIKRQDVLDYLESMGINVKNTQNGQYLGVYDIIKNTAKKYTESDENQKRDIGEQLGGSRQIGRIMPVLSDWAGVQKIVNEQMSAGGSIEQDRIKGMQSMATQLEVLKTKMVALIQVMAPDVFVPFVKSLTYLGSVTVGVTSAISPLLSTMLQLGVVVAALKGAALIPALGRQFSSMGKAAAANGENNAFGLIGGAAGSMNQGGILDVLGLGALARQNVGMPSVGKETLGKGVQTVAGSKALQLGGAAIAIVGLDFLSKRAHEAGSDLGELAAQASKYTLMTIAMLSVLQNKTIGQTMKGYQAGGLIGGALNDKSSTFDRGFSAAAGYGLKVGLPLVAVELAAYHQVADSITQLLDDVAKHIKEMPIPTTSAEAETSIRDLQADILGGIRESAKKYTGFKGTLAGAGQRVSSFAGNLMSGDWGEALSNFNPKKSNVDAGAVIDQLVKANLPLINEQIKQAMLSTGTGFRGFLHANLADKASQLGSPDPNAVADKVLAAIVKASGGAQALGNKLREVTEEIEITGLPDAAIKASKELARLVVPPQLFASLNTLTKVVEETAKSMDATLGAFDSVSQTIGSITAPSLPQQVDPQSAAKLLSANALKGLTSARPEIQNVTKLTDFITEATDQFVTSFAESEQKMQDAIKSGKSSKSWMDGADFDKFLDGFFTGDRKVPDAVRGSMRKLLGDIYKSMKEGTDFANPGPNKEKLKELIQANLKQLIPNYEQAGQVLSDELGAKLRMLGKSLEIDANLISREVNAANTPESLALVTGKMLKGAGIKTPYEAGKATPAGVFKDEDVLDAFSKKVLENTQQLGETQKLLFQSLATGRAAIDKFGKERSIPELLNTFNSLTRTSTRLQGAQESLARSFGEYEQFLSERFGQQKDALRSLEDYGVQEKTLKETQKEIGRQVGGVGSTPAKNDALRLQSDQISFILPYIEKINKIGEQIKQNPAEDNKERYKELQRAIIEYNSAKATKAEENANRIRYGSNPIPDEASVAGISSDLADQIKAQFAARRTADEGKLDLRQMDVHDKVAEEVRRMSELNQKREEILGKLTIGDDPFGSKRFSTAVDVFVRKVGAPQDNIPSPTSQPAFNKEGKIGAVGAKDTDSLDRVLFGGMNRKELTTLTNSVLAGDRNPGVPAKSIDELRKMPLVAQPESAGAFPGMYRPDGSGQPQMERLDAMRKTADAVRDAMKEQGYGSDEQTTGRLMRFFTAGGEPDVSRFSVSPNEQSQFDLNQRFNAVRDRNRPTTQPAGDLVLPEPQRLLTPSPTTQPLGAVIDPTQILQNAKLGVAMGAIRGQNNNDGAVVSALGRLADNLQSTNQTASDSLRQAASEITKGTGKQSDGVTKEHTEALKNTQDSQQALADRLEKTTEAIRDGVEFKVESVQKVDINLTGLTETLEKELSPYLTEATKRIATDVLRKTLLDIANSSDSEGARVFNNAARNLG